MEREIKFAESRIGRVALHLMGLNKDYHFKFHYLGIMREIKFL